MRRNVVSRVRLVILAGCCLVVTGLWAGETGFQITEHVFNAGGHPNDGQFPTSSSFRISLGAIGDAVSGVLMCSAQFCIASGPVAPHGPPGSVRNLRFSQPDELEWDPVGLAEAYNLYRGGLGSLPGGYGTCLAGDLPSTTVPVPDDPVGAGQGFFYLVTASNAIGGEGNKGTDSAGDVRPNSAPCP